LNNFFECCVYYCRRRLAASQCACQSRLVITRWHATTILRQCRDCQLIVSVPRSASPSSPTGTVMSDCNTTAADIYKSVISPRCLQ